MHKVVDNQPNKNPKKNGGKGSVGLLKNSTPRSKFGKERVHHKGFVQHSERHERRPYAQNLRTDLKKKP